MIIIINYIKECLTLTDNKDNDSISSYEDDESNDKKVLINKYYGNVTKSVFEIKDLKLYKEKKKKKIFFSRLVWAIEKTSNCQWSMI